MDYKYIDQLLNRYWEGNTSLEEENILRAFFSQDSIPAELMRYKPLFRYEATEAKRDVLDDDFDTRLLSAIDERKPVKAHVITMAERFKPLLKAAAMVAVFLTLGNAMQVPFSHSDNDPISNYDGYYKPEIDNGTNVAIGDSSMIDTLQQSLASPDAPASMPVLK